MKRSKFSEAQIVFVLKQAQDGTSVGEVCRKTGVSEATFHTWRKKYAGLMPSEMQRLFQLDEENAKLTRLGYPASIRVDQGSEVSSRDLDLWAYTRGVTLDFGRPGRPADNAFIESFNGKFWAECPNLHWFMSLDDAVQKCEAWRRDYEEVRPPSTIGNETPISLVNRSAAHGPPRPAGAG